MDSKQIASAVIRDAVNARIQQRRIYANHWFYYMNDEQRNLFAGLTGFKQQCNEYYQRIMG